MRKLRKCVHFSWICSVLVSCDSSREENPEVQSTDPRPKTEGVSGNEELLTLREEIRSQMKAVGYFDETNLIKKKITLIEIVGQIAPNFDYSLDINQFTFLVDELREVAPEAFKKATEKKDGNVDLLALLDHIYSNESF